MRLENDVCAIDKPVVLENGSVINRFSHAVAGSEIGENVMIGEHCYVARGAKIGNGCRIQNHVNIWDGVTLHENVFVGPFVCFTNCRDPHTRLNPDRQFTVDKTTVQENVTIGAATVIMAPREIGRNVRIGAGSIVLRDLKDEETANWLIK